MKISNYKKFAGLAPVISVVTIFSKPYNVTISVDSIEEVHRIGNILQNTDTNKSPATNFPEGYEPPTIQYFYMIKVRVLHVRNPYEMYVELRKDGRDAITGCDVWKYTVLVPEWITHSNNSNEVQHLIRVESMQNPKKLFERMTDTISLVFEREYNASLQYDIETAALE